MGGSQAVKPLTANDRALLDKGLNHAAWWNNILATVLIVVQAALLIFCCLVAWNIIGNPSAYKAILGGSLVTLAPLTGVFAYVWKTKHQMDIMRAILPLMSSEKLTQLAIGIAAGDLKSITKNGLKL